MNVLLAIEEKMISIGVYCKWSYSIYR